MKGVHEEVSQVPGMAFHGGCSVPLCYHTALQITVPRLCTNSCLSILVRINTCLELWESGHFGMILKSLFSMKLIHHIAKQSEKHKLGVKGEFKVRNLLKAFYSHGSILGTGPRNAL